jgi:hypothetical protein
MASKAFVSLPAIYKISYSISNQDFEQADHFYSSHYA